MVATMETPIGALAVKETKRMAEKSANRMSQEEGESGSESESWFKSTCRPLILTMCWQLWPTRL